MSENRTTNKLAVVTGTSSGIGETVATTLLEAGWMVLGIARRPGVIQHPHYRHRQLDLADTEAVETYFTGAFLDDFPPGGRERVGLVNNAGLLDPVALMPGLPMAEVARAFTVNTVVPLWLGGFFLRTFTACPLRIVNVSSGAAANARSGWSVYCGTKAALQMAGRVFAEEAASGIAPYDQGHAALLTLAPGIVDTAMQTRIRGTSPRDFPAVERFVGMHEKGELIGAEKPAREILAFLESDPDTPHAEKRITQ